MCYTTTAMCLYLKLLAIYIRKDVQNRVFTIILICLNGKTILLLESKNTLERQPIMNSIFLCIFTLFAILRSHQVVAQEFNYAHYDTKDGLAGSTVYDMCQDKDGFLWFATENGLSRYSGSSFKNYTVQDGLPDNEVLKIFPDSRGRVWIATFNKKLSYYFKGKIYTEESDPLLLKLSLPANITSIVEGIDSTLFFCDGKTIALLNSKKTAIVQKTTVPGSFLGLYEYNYKGKNIYASNENGDVFKYNKDLNTFLFYSTTPKDLIPANNQDIWIGTKFDSTRVIKKIKSKPGFIKVIFLDKDLALLSSDGVWFIDTTKNAWTSHYLPGKSISEAIKDTEGNLWFSTIGEGTFKLPSTETKTISFKKEASVDNSEVFALDKSLGKIVCGRGFNTITEIDKDKKLLSIDFSSDKYKFRNNQPNNRLYAIKTLSTGTVILGFDSYLIKWQAGKPLLSNTVATKSIDQIDEDNILVGTSRGAFKVRVKDMKVMDTIWKERCTKVFCYEDEFYIGTLNGLYKVHLDKTYNYLGNLHPALSRRISDIEKTDEGILWIATYDNGLVALKNDQVIASKSENSGLSSNICKSLFIQSPFLWVVTNKGLNKVNFKNISEPVVVYGTSDGLPSDVLNAVYVTDSIIFTGSAAGLSYFNENNISSTSMCNLQMMAITVAGKEQEISNSYEISYKENSIKFTYMGISIKSGKGMSYHYKLSGIDTTWMQTSQTSLTYQSLPSGNYELQIYAINKFGVESKPIKIQFTISTPFWNTWWFLVLAILTIIGATIWIVRQSAKKRIAELKEKNMIEKQFAAMEQQALQAQMNPHFIFNCLNSIQQYIILNNKEKANEYLAGFADLIRLTLDLSGKKAISLSEEVSYLSKYLNMEKLRFGDGFAYSIEVDKNIQSDSIKLPAMLLQPYVENSLRHGIRYKEDGFGKVEISFNIIANILYSTVKDNGIGRKKAAELKSHQHIEYQSRGMDLTQKRIMLLNKVYDDKIEVEISDLQDNNQEATGTSILLKIPIK